VSPVASVTHKHFLGAIMTPPAPMKRVKLACALVVGTIGIYGATSAQAVGEIHRCTYSGAVTYTDRGCDASAQSMVFTVASSGPRDFSTVDRELPVTLGMSPRKVFDTLGRPRETIAALQGRELVEYWLYRGAAGGVTRVAFHEGRVSSIHAR
jgi:hypothetical protein